MANMTAEQAFLEIVKNGHLEDRREYEVDQLQKMYDLSDEESDALFQHIQIRFKTSMQEVDAMPAQGLKDMLVAALIDTDLEGWTETQKVTIESFLMDLAWGYKHI
jgi:hypothetical protein